MAFRVTISHPFDINGLWLNEATMVKCWERKNYSDEEGRLTIRDYPADQGQEPNPEFDKKFTWNSPDIWNNVTIDGPIHQIFPTIKADLKNNIHFRVWNKGCQTSKVPDDTKRKNQIFLYYQADRELPWWDGGFRTPRGIEGDLLGTDTIPPLEPGEYYQGQISYTLVDVSEQENTFLGEYMIIKTQPLQYLMEH